RAARQAKLDVISYVKLLSEDKDPQVLREAAISLRNEKSPEAAELWAKLAMQYDGQDRWYLEALGIGAENQWDHFFAAWLEKAGDNPLNDASKRDIIWRARTAASVPLLAELANNPSTALENRLRYFRAFDFNPDTAGKSKALVGMLNGTSEDQEEIDKLVLAHLDPS